MKISRIRSALFRRLWLILAVTAAGSCLTALVGSYVAPPVYQAKMSLFLYSKADTSPQNGATYNQIMANNQLAKDYSQIITSDKVLQSTINQLGYSDLTVKKLLKDVNVKNQDNSDIITLTVKANSPQRAADIANTIAGQFITTIRGLTNQNNINIVDRATRPDKPVIPQAAYVLISAAVLLVGSAGMVILLEYLDSTVRTVEDVEERLATNVIGIVPMMGIR